DEGRAGGRIGHGPAVEGGAAGQPAAEGDRGAHHHRAPEPEHHGAIRLSSAAWVNSTSLSYSFEVAEATAPKHSDTNTQVRTVMIAGPTVRVSSVPRRCTGKLP